VCAGEEEPSEPIGQGAILGERTRSRTRDPPVAILQERKRGLSFYIITRRKCLSGLLKVEKILYFYSKKAKSACPGF